MKKKEHGWEDLCGVTKLIFFLAWTITCMLTYDTRVLAIMLATSLILLNYQDQLGTWWFRFKVILVFMIINILAIFIFARDREQRSMAQSTSFTVWAAAGW